MKFSQAYGRGKEPFDVVCSQFLALCPTPVKKYDFAFIDEGQDFPISFINLIAASTKNARVVWAYDELQSIFSNAIPSSADITHGIASDVILYKCYRNPREILVCAHALGFGIYSRIVQMLETEDRWVSAGYRITDGELKAGSMVTIERPIENTLTSLSASQDLNEIIRCEVFEEFEDEVEFCAESIENDITQGLRPDDILVIAIDDRNAKSYLNSVSSALFKLDISFNNIHADVYDLVDFEKEGKVTLSTLSKAKGNEAYSVYILGIDAVMSYGSKTNRNKIFTALTRSKGWVTITGMGHSAAQFKVELEMAKHKFPTMQFVYPPKEALEIIPDDMSHISMKKIKEEQEFDRFVETLGPDKIRELVNKKLSHKKKNAE
ncbi:MAG: ATP-binding domain-containing protein [Desulfovibrio sp.]|uniref:ATP-binding domain-containing protein n=1 Tax=Desulfovibrio sp. TaxID=885 RepID=UPI0039E61C76